jgi:magnesium transporter
LVEPLHRLASGHYPVIHDDVRAYFRDVYDHAIRTDERTEGFRELLTGILEANLAQVTARQNEDVRRISAWVAILAVPTMIAAIYGMNFDFMPELDEPWGYPAVLGLMACACAFLYWRLKRAGWL